MTILFFLTWATNLALVILALQQREEIGWYKARRRKRYGARIVKGPGAHE